MRLAAHGSHSQSAGILKTRTDAIAPDGQMMMGMIHSTGIWGSYPEPSVHETPAVPDGEISRRLFDEQHTKATTPRVASEVELTEAGGVSLKGWSRVWPHFV